MRERKIQKKLFLSSGSEFAQRVYAIVAKIPRGKTLSYGEVARRAGRPNAFRAVGSIMSKNRDFCVPCHRVVRKDGAPGGYAFGGSQKKRALLKKEGVVI